MVSKMLSCTLKFISFGNLGVMNIVCVSLTHNIVYAIFTFLIVQKKWFCLFVCFSIPLLYEEGYQDFK